MRELNTSLNAYFLVLIIAMILSGSVIVGFGHAIKKHQSEPTEERVCKDVVTAYGFINPKDYKDSMELCRDLYHQ